MNSKVMKRALFLTTLLASVVSLSACSYINDFVVVNKSGESIEVQYKLKSHTPETPDNFIGVKPPAKQSLEDFEAENYEWKEVPKEQYRFDNLTGTFKVSVAPNEVLRVDSEHNYSGAETEFKLASISLEGTKGYIKLEGRQAQTQFKRASKSYIIEYQ